MSASQTPVHVSLLQKLFAYFELAASLGMFIPEKHVQAIATIIGEVTADLTGGPSPILQLMSAPPVVAPPPQPVIDSPSIGLMVVATPQQKAPDVAPVLATNPGPVKPTSS